MSITMLGADLDCDNKFKAKIHVSIKDNLDNICIIKVQKDQLRFLNHGNQVLIQQ